jgi:hypothetical protein
VVGLRYVLEYAWHDDVPGQVSVEDHMETGQGGIDCAPDCLSIESTHGLNAQRGMNRVAASILLQYPFFKQHSCCVWIFLIFSRLLTLLFLIIY